MKAKSRRFMSQNPEVPLSAMIDVVFLLLIYFIVAQKPIVEDAFLSAGLPGGGGKAAPIRGGVLKIAVCEIPGRSDDYYGLNGRPVHFDDLRNCLASVAESAKDSAVIALCDPNAKHAKLIRLLDACSDLGLSNISVVNDESVLFKPALKN